MNGLLNVAILVAILALSDALNGDIAVERLGFMLLLVTLLVTLYDRYRPEHVARFAAAGPRGTRV